MMLLMTKIHPPPFNPSGDWPTKGKPSSKLRTWNSVRNSVPQGNTGFHQCHRLMNVSRTWAILCQTWFGYAGATAQMGGSRMSLTAGGFSCWSRCQYCELCSDMSVNCQGGLICFTLMGPVLPLVFTVTTLSTELPKNHRDKVLALSGWLCNTQKSEHIELNQLPILNLCLSIENCNSQSRRDVRVLRHTGNYKERLDADSWFQSGTFPTMPLSLLGSHSQTGRVCVKGSFPLLLVPGVSR